MWRQATVAILYEHANEFIGYGASVDLLEDCPDLSVYGFDKKTSYVHVFRAERDGFVWARGAIRDGQFVTRALGTANAQAA